MGESSSSSSYGRKGTDGIERGLCQRCVFWQFQPIRHHPAIAHSTRIYYTNFVTINNQKTNWQLDLKVFWDGDSKTFCGNTEGQMGDTILGQNTLQAKPPADPNLHNNSNSFQGVFYALGVTGQFNSSNAGNHAFLDVFTLELL